MGYLIYYYYPSEDEKILIGIFDDEKDGLRALLENLKDSFFIDDTQKYRKCWSKPSMKRIQNLIEDYNIEIFSEFIKINSTIDMLL